MPVSVAMAVVRGLLDWPTRKFATLPPEDLTVRVSSRLQDRLTGARRRKAKAARFIIDGRNNFPVAAGDSEAIVSPSDWTFKSEPFPTLLSFGTDYKSDTRALGSCSRSAKFG